VPDMALRPTESDALRLAARPPILLNASLIEVDAHLFDDLNLARLGGDPTAGC
jgi:hypothetical protein